MDQTRREVQGQDAGQQRRRRYLQRVFILVLLLLGLLVGVAMIDGCAAIGARAQGPRLLRIERSSHWRDGRFVNPLPAEKIAFWRTLKDWFRGAEHRVPEKPLPIIERKATDFTQRPESSLRITWLGHSSTLLEIDGQTILIDPVWSERASPFSWSGPKRFHPLPLALDELPRLDAVIISHDHYDHLDQKTVIALAKQHQRFIMPLGVGAHLEHWGIPADQIVELDWWDEIQLGELTLVATPGRHFSGRSVFGTDRCKTLWAGWAVLGPKHRVFYSGDTAMFGGFTDIGRRYGPFDMTLIEIGAYNPAWRDYHIGPEQAVKAHQMLGGKLMIPVHWGTFNLALHSWTEPVERLIVAAWPADVAIALPRPGESVEAQAPPPLERWWPNLPWQSANESPLISSSLGGGARAK